MVRPAMNFLYKRKKFHSQGTTKNEDTEDTRLSQKIFFSLEKVFNTVLFFKFLSAWLFHN